MSSKLLEKTVSVTKALNTVEAALKVKHARAVIIATFRMNGAHSFWAVVLRQPLMENRFTAWKFCHLLHKVLREGHSICNQYSLRHRKMLIELGKLWGHLNDGYGICIKNYTKLLVTKIEFHDRNSRFPGNLVLGKGEWEKISGNDINIHFQLAIEMFDYLDDIIALQATIFTSVNTFQITSMTSAGQCRLAPLIPLIQDSNQLYDFIIRLMFKLHSHLPNDLLSGHRARFRSIFLQLKKFYDQARDLQYFVNLITVPILPETTPNFNSKVDFGSYIPPIVVVPETETEQSVDNLVDMTDNRQRTPDEVPCNQEINIDKLIKDRDELIMHLQTEIDHLRKSIKAMTVAQRQEINQMEEQLSVLNAQLHDTQEELTNMRITKEEMELKIQITPTLEQKAIAVEERAKASEEKFQKLKAMYTQIRDEHVSLLRQHGEMAKELSLSKSKITDFVKEKDTLNALIEGYQEKQSNIEEQFQRNNKIIDEKKELSENYEKLKVNFEEFQNKYDDLQANKSAEVAELHLKLNGLEYLHANHEKLQKEYQELTSTLKSKENMINELEQKTQEISEELQNKSLFIDKTLKEFKELESSSTMKYNELFMHKKEVEEAIESKDNEIKSLKQMLIETEERSKTNEAKVERLTYHKSNIECDLQDILHQQAELNEKYKNALETISALDSSLQDAKIHGEIAVRTLLESCIKSSEKLARRAMTENDFKNAAGTSSYFMMIAEEFQDCLKELIVTYEKYLNDNSCVESFTRKTILAGNLSASVQEQGMSICNISADIECGERIVEKIKSFSRDVVVFFETLKQLPPVNEITNKITSIKDALKSIMIMIHELSKKSENSEQITDMVEIELLSMDKSIEEAAARIAEMLSNSKKSDSGIKLEVNEKILDACTNLMQCIRILVQKSRILQSEIVSLGKGTASAKEFYKRNHQWTEGLISAAKNVAIGANLLVTASNKAVSGEAKHHLDLVVAAQEIAASTAQLVVASRVKAPRNSINLTALAKASNNVTQATGAVVATAKDCSQQLEDLQDLDLSELTVHQAKTLEMEIQVKVLELEQALQMERLRLAAFRRKNYQNSNDK